MAENLEHIKRAGTFSISPEKDIYGELTIDGSNTSLYLRDKNMFDPHGARDQYIKGILHDLTRVSLFKCITLEGPGHSTIGEETYHFATIFPHFVVSGKHHLGPTDKKILNISLVMDDASTLFYDFDAFGHVLDANKYIEQITHANEQKLGRTITTGSNSIIQYFTGKSEIFAANTAIGKITARHSPSYDLGGPDGLHIDNTIYVTIEFKEASDLEQAVNHVSTLLRYLEMLVGRPQNLLKVMLQIESGEELPAILQVHWSMPPRRKKQHEEEGRKPHPGDILMDAVCHPESFTSVTMNWFDKQEERHDARYRFSSSFSKQSFYDTDRLVGAANMFDILPDTAVPPNVELTEELQSAKEQCRAVFKELPHSQERDSVLNALGRLGKSSLKHKIRHRAEFISSAIGNMFPELNLVIDEAVNCRNHYVHGTKGRFDYSNNVDTTFFFTDTLEFVYAASELIEAGWDIERWRNNGTTMSHPFGRYCVNYAANLQELKNILGIDGGSSQIV